jgi:hypothetical protein
VVRGGAGSDPAFATLVMENRYTGHTDEVSSAAISGWCKPVGSSTPRATVEVYEAETRIGSVIADAFRADLLALGGDGRHGFTYRLPSKFRDGAIHHIRICVGLEQQPLTAAPIEIAAQRARDPQAAAPRRVEIGDLPIIHRMEGRLRHGRNVYEGYQRGLGICSAELRKLIADDPDYLAALQAMADRSILDTEKTYNLFLLFKFFLPKLPAGHIIEFGAYRGGSALFMGSLAKKFLPGADVYALDTFDGMPTTDKEIDAHNRGDFDATSLVEIEEAKADLGLHNVHFIAGLFCDTAPSVLQQAKSICLAHIDCDIYDSVRYAYLTAKPHMVPMGYYVFDDSVSPSCIGATEVVEDIVIRHDGLMSEQVFPHHVFRAK